MLQNRTNLFVANIPFWIMVIFIINLYLAGMGVLFYQIVMVLQLLFYLLAVAGFLIKKSSEKAPWINLSSSYLLVNLAYALGWFKYLKGDTYTSWVPKR